MDVNSSSVTLVAVSKRMGSLDLAVFSAMLASSAVIGCYFGLCDGRKKNSTQEYLMGGRNMGMLPVALSLVASFISGITIQGEPAEIYTHGTQYWCVLLVSYLASFVAAMLYIPVFVNLQLNSCYEYLELRFNTKVRKMASILFVISQVAYIPVIIYIPSLAFSQVTGIDVNLVVPVASAICIFYTTIGGLKAVVWTDTLQSVLMMCAMITVFVIGLINIGGWSNVWRASERGHRLEFFNLDPNPTERHTFWTLLIGGFFNYLSPFTTNQGMVQRYLAVPDLKTVYKCLACFATGLVLFKSLSIATGLLLFATYEGCDPVAAHKIQRHDQLMPFFVLDVAGHIPGLGGLFVAGIFSAALSSMSTGLNALSGVLVEDLLAPWLPKENKILWLRIAAAVCGFVSLALVFVVQHLGGVLQVALSLGGITLGALLGVFTLGMFFPKATSKGALIGSILSLVVTGTIVLGAQAALFTGALRHPILPVSTETCAENRTLFLDNIPILDAPHDNSGVWFIFRISYWYYTVIGTAIVLAVGYPVSIFCETDVEDQRPRKRNLFSPVIQRYLPADEDDKMPEKNPLVTLSEEAINYKYCLADVK
ncbi:sodium-dependent multivitamin transporter-like [Neocloeon triangulifer]|uniref:sodium-dependent multivitamin transporter-like n=1 Tax=Neocloeon triangulifer TaxID=2078957 RepID=UPI00286EFA9C|nr:sodium-dependent multivitamin transporter-like [Neocloeon triangulifer]